MEQTQSNDINDLATALVRVQSTLEGAKKDSKNPFFKSDYADLESVWKACREPLTKNGFCVIQTMGGTADAPSIITTLAHTSGQWIRGELTIAPDKRTPQGIGSAITYGRRYSLAAIVGVIQVDDDAEGAMNRTPPKDTTKAGVDDIPLGGGYDKKEETIEEKGKRLEQQAKAKESVITEKQRKRMFAIGQDNGWAESGIREVVEGHGFTSTRDITVKVYEDIIKQLQEKKG